MEAIGRVKMAIRLQYNDYEEKAQEEFMDD